MAIDVAATVEGLDRVGDEVRRAVEWAMRSTGRTGRRVARAKAPVYDGKKRIGVRRLELQRGIKASKNIEENGPELSMFVGPFGPRYKASYDPTPRRYPRKGSATAVYGTPLFRRQQEARFGYMAAGRLAAERAAHFYAVEGVTVAIEQT